MYVLAIDLGSTFFKCATVDIDGEGRARIVRTVRVQVDQAKWSPGQGAARLEAAVRNLLGEAGKLVSEARPLAISLTGVREGVAVIRKTGELRLVLGSIEAMSWQMRHGDGWLAQVIAASKAKDAVVMSFAGWAGMLLTGRAAITNSELLSWRASPQAMASEGPLALAARCLPEVVRVGEPLGRSSLFGGIPVAIAGTDEQASHWGAGLGLVATAEIAASTHWSLSRALDSPPPALPAHIRILSAVDPYPVIGSYLGYRWGEYLSDIQQGRVPQVRDPLPPWSKSNFVQALREGRCSSIQDARALVRQDLHEGFRTLHPHETSLEPPVIVHGGGSGPGSLVRAVIADLGWPATFLQDNRQDDPTLLGGALVVAGTAGDLSGGAPSW